MTSPTDPKAERIKAKKAKKDRAKLRKVIREDGIITAAKFFLSGIAPAPLSDECPDCKAMQDHRGHRRPASLAA